MQPVEFSVGVSVLKDDVFPFDIAKLAQPFFRNPSSWAEKEDTDSGAKTPIRGILAGCWA